MELKDLGTPVRIYNIHRTYRLVLRCSSLLLHLMSITVVLLTVLNLHTLRADPPSSLLLLVAVVLMGVGGFEYVALVLIPHEQQMRLIIGEKGFLQIKKKLRKNEVMVISWEEVVAVTREFDAYYVRIRREREDAYPIFGGYERSRELVDVIKERSAEALSLKGSHEGYKGLLAHKQSLKTQARFHKQVLERRERKVD